MRIALYGNGSSGNHGCEAIVRGTYTLIKEPLTILSEEMDEDIIYGLAKFCNVLDAKNGKISKARLIRAYMKLKLKNNYTDMDGLPYVDSIKKIKGKVFWLQYTGDDICPIWKCCKDQKRNNCGGCPRFPCSHFVNDSSISK